MKLVLVFVLIATATAQQTTPQWKEAHPYERWQWDCRRLGNPQTGRVPPDAAIRDAAFARRLLAATPSKMAPLTTVQPIGPTNVAGRTRALAFDRRSAQVIMTGGVTGGIWRSIDGGSTWVRMTPPTLVPAVSCIVQSVQNPDTWYVGTGEGLSTTERRTSTLLRTIGTGTGIYRSTDNGARWHSISPPITGQPNALPTQAWQIVWRLAVAAHDTGELLYAACYGGIYAWDGARWHLELGDTASPAFCTEIIAVGDRLYAAIGARDDGTAPSQYGIFVRSLRGGGWRQITPAGFPPAARRIVLAASADGSALYVFTQTPRSWNARYSSFASQHTLWLYQPATDSWVDRSAWLNGLKNPQQSPLETLGGYCMALAVHPQNPNVVYVGSTDVFLSLDGCVASAIHLGGYPYRVESGSLHPDVHALVFPPNSPGQLYAATDGGIYRTTTPLATNGAWWEALNDGLTTTQAYHVALNRAVPASRFVIAGFQDNSNWYTSSATYGEPWSFAYGGDGCRVLVAEQGKLIVASSQFGSVYALDERINLLSMPSPPRSGSAFVTEVAYDESLHAVILALDNALYRLGYANGSFDPAWMQAAVIPRPDLITTLAVRDGIALAGTADGRLYRCNLTTGQVEQFTAAPIPADAFIAAIDWDEADPRRIIVTISNYTLPSILATWDGGATWQWVGGSLDEDSSGWGPSVRVVHSIVQNGKRLYVAGTSIGAFVADSLSAQTAWQPLGLTTLGVLPVEAIDVRSSDGLTVLGTHGGGIFLCTLRAGELGADSQQPSPSDFLVESPIPTPTTDYALIRVHLPHGGGALLLELYDALGRKLSEQRQQPSQAGVVPFLLAPTDLGELPAGTYIYRVLWENRKASGVLIKVQ